MTIADHSPTLTARKRAARLTKSRTTTDDDPRRRRTNANPEH